MAGEAAEDASRYTLARKGGPQGMAASWSERIFRRIYRRNALGDGESKSGPGSSVFRTRLLRPQITQLVADLGVRSLLDIPCGDFNWMRLTELPGVDYVGADIVAELVERNQSRHGGPGRRFVQLDMRRDPLPRADLVLCRDGLVHLSFADIARALQQIRQSGSTYLLATTFTAHPSNSDISAGSWRPLNLEIPPFDFPAPQSILPDGPRPDGSYPDKALALYRIADLPPRR